MVCLLHFKPSKTKNYPSRPENKSFRKILTSSSGEMIIELIFFSLIASFIFIKALKQYQILNSTHKKIIYKTSKQWRILEKRYSD